MADDVRPARGTAMLAASPTGCADFFPPAVERLRFTSGRSKDGAMSNEPVHRYLAGWRLTFR